MRRGVRISVGCLCLTLCLSTPCFAKAWRGIVPLHSTRSDVIKLLGEPRRLLWVYRDFFILDAETVTFRWIDPTCVRKYPVEPDSEVRADDLVLNISVIPKRPTPQDELLPPVSPEDELRLPLKLYSMSCMEGGACIFMDEEEGFAFSTSREGVTSHSYGPPAEEYKAWVQGHSACRPVRQGAT